VLPRKSGSLSLGMVLIAEARRGRGQCTLGGRKREGKSSRKGPASRSLRIGGRFFPDGGGAVWRKRMCNWGGVK